VVAADGGEGAANGLLAGVYATFWSQMAFNVAVIIVVLTCGVIGAYREIASRLGRGCFQ